MRHLWINVAILFLLTVELLTGIFGFANGHYDRRWILWIHGVGAYAIALALIWKGAVILEAFRRRRGLNLVRLAFALMLLLLVGTLLSGLLWTTTGPYYLFGFSSLTLHIFVAIPLSLLAIWHFLQHRWVVRAPETVNRRSFINYSLVGVAGILLWVTTRQTKRLLNLPGSRRRFTGSFETGSYTGIFPAVSWIADRHPSIDLSQYQLTITGAVDRQIILTYDEVKMMSNSHVNAILDCTGGWYTEQIWQGVRLTDLLDNAGLSPDAKSVSVQSLTGFERKFSLEESLSFVLAIGVADGILSREHGFPVRLVAPGQRGVHWVKWVETVIVNRTSKFWQSPLPLQ
jgi:DMSO/TMAO reductase YedYZ molybdopterin-dependent catalytic subunit